MKRTKVKRIKAWAVVDKFTGKLLKTSTYAGHKIYHISIKKEKSNGYECGINIANYKSVPCEIIIHEVKK